MFCLSVGCEPRAWRYATLVGRPGCWRWLCIAKLFYGLDATVGLALWRLGSGASFVVSILGAECKLPLLAPRCLEPLA